nr:MAG TPA: hypothetical protein [Caudoviricetes sp.]
MALVWSRIQSFKHPSNLCICLLCDSRHELPP